MWQVLPDAGRAEAVGGSCLSDLLTQSCSPSAMPVHLQLDSSEFNEEEHLAEMMEGEGYLE